MQVVQTVPPVSTSISLIDAKAFLRILHSEDDALITDIIKSVEEHTQGILNRQLEVATYELYTDDFISKLPKNPIKEVLKIEYMGEDGLYVELDSSTYYLYERNGIGYISYASIPLFLEHKKAIKITFTCGYNIVPAPIKSYMKVKISTYYENREEFVIGVGISRFNESFIDNLLKPYRVMP
ncbi:MAG: head-tail connector protein [Sulfurimonas sp.]